MGPKKGKKDLKNHEDDRGKRLAKRKTDLMNNEDKNSEGAKKDKTKKKKTKTGFRNLRTKGHKAFKGQLISRAIFGVFQRKLRISFKRDQIEKNQSI